MVIIVLVKRLEPSPPDSTHKEFTPRSLADLHSCLWVYPSEEDREPTDGACVSQRVFLWWANWEVYEVKQSLKVRRNSACPFLRQAVLGCKRNLANVSHQGASLWFLLPVLASASGDDRPQAISWNEPFLTLSCFWSEYFIIQQEGKQNAGFSYASR